ATAVVPTPINDDLLQIEHATQGVGQHCSGVVASRGVRRVVNSVAAGSTLWVNRVRRPIRQSNRASGELLGKVARAGRGELSLDQIQARSAAARESGLERIVYRSTFGS